VRNISVELIGVESGVPVEISLEVTLTYIKARYFWLYILFYINSQDC